MKRIMCVDHDFCNGCTTCQMVCSLSHGGQCNPKESRIHIVKNERQAIYVPVVCIQCENPPCLATCAVGAIYKNSKTGVVFVDEELCDGCGMCVTSCPHGAVSLYPDTGRAFVCDLCGGKPKCVDFCPTGVLCYCTPHQFAAARRRSAVRHAMQGVLKSRDSSKDIKHE